MTIPCRKLDERERRKKFVLEHGLIDYKSLQNKEKRKPKDERELLAKMRVFARFHTPEEHEKFVAVSECILLIVVVVVEGGGGGGASGLNAFMFSSLMIDCAVI